MKGTGSKNAWALFLLLLAGIVLGGFIGMLAEGVPSLDWLAYGQSFGAGRAYRAEFRCPGRYVWSIDQDNNRKYYWRDSFDFNLSLLIIKYDELVR